MPGPKAEYEVFLLVWYRYGIPPKPYAWMRVGSPTLR